jgi:hypothetical protein
LSLATLSSFILSENNDEPFIKNIPLLVIKNNLPITPKMQLIQKIISPKNKKNYMFLYSGPLTADTKDNLMSKFYKWTALHIDDLSLTLSNNIVVNNNTLQIPETDEINKINKAFEDLEKNKITKKDITDNNVFIHPFYENPLFLEDCKLTNNLAKKCNNYTATIVNEAHTFILFHKDLNLGFIKHITTQINSNALIDIIHSYKAIVVESIEMSFSTHETIINNKYQYFSVLENKGIYYLFLGIDLGSENNFIIKIINNLFKHLLWDLLSGVSRFSFNSCLIIKIDDVNNLKEILQSAIEAISYTTGKMHVYTFFSKKNLNKLKNIPSA